LIGLRLCFFVFLAPFFRSGAKFQERVTWDSTAHGPSFTTILIENFIDRLGRSQQASVIASNTTPKHNLQDGCERERYLVVPHSGVGCAFYPDEVASWLEGKAPPCPFAADVSITGLCLVRHNGLERWSYESQRGNRLPVPMYLLHFRVVSALEKSRNC